MHHFPLVGAVSNRARVRGRLDLIGQTQMQEPPVGAVFNRAQVREHLYLIGQTQMQEPR